MFENTFLLKIYPKLPKNILQSVMMAKGVLSPPTTTVHWSESQGSKPFDLLDFETLGVPLSNAAARKAVI